MNNLITGIHHVSLNCTPEELPKVRDFYENLLGLKMAREWDGGIMFCTGGGIIEVFVGKPGVRVDGEVTHFALATKDVPACVKAVRDAGYEITTEITDACIPSEPPMPLQMAFCRGPVGESIEFFNEL